MPDFEVIYKGLKNGETKDVLNPVISCTAEDTSTPGTYEINVTVTTDNYEVKIKKGTLTILPTKIDISISAAGIATYSSQYDLDFSGLTELRAYTAMGYNKNTGNITLVKVNDVPAGTGLILKGTKGTYTVTCSESATYLVNILVGVTEPVIINTTDGKMSNFILSNGSNGIGFYAVPNNYTVAANKAYLQLPTSMIGAANANYMGIEFEDETEGIDQLQMTNEDPVWYSLDGRRLNGKPAQKGIYVVNGSKMIIK